MAESLTRPEPVQRFVAQARAFCEPVENRGPLSPIAFAEEPAVALAKLCEAGLGLTEVPVVREAAIEDHNPRERVAGMIANVHEKFGRYTQYYTVLDPFELEEPVGPALWDDFTDIYRT